jgi:hypothetical protein
MNSFLWPYEETKVQFHEGFLHLAAPWLHVKEKSALNPGQGERVAKLLEDGPQSGDDLHFMHAFCAPFEIYPLFYLLPRHGLPADPAMKPVAPGSPKRWAADDALPFAEVGPGLYDPLSLLSAFRLLHLNDVIAQTGSDSTAAIIREAPLEKRKAALAHIVRQNHYVTQRCEGALAPARRLHPAAGEKVTEFMKEEKGHDKLLGFALKSLGFEAESLAPLPSIVELMDRFQQTAETSLLGFCFLVDMFERSPYSGRNPVVEALIELGEEVAARPLKAHADINVNGEHHNESFEILGVAGAVSEEYALEGMRLAQEASDALIRFVKERASFVRKL